METNYIILLNLVEAEFIDLNDYFALNITKHDTMLIGKYHEGLSARLLKKGFIVTFSNETKCRFTLINTNIEITLIR